MSNERLEVTGCGAKETEAAAGSGIDASAEESASPTTARDDTQDGSTAHGPRGAVAAPRDSDAVDREKDDPGGQPDYGEGQCACDAENDIDGGDGDGEDGPDGEDGLDGVNGGEQGRELLDLAAPMWSAGQTARQLGLRPAELLAATAAGRILGVSPLDSDRKSYPVAQFERTSEGVIRVKSYLQGFITTLLAGGSRDPWTCVICFHLPSPELDGMTPLEWARARKDPETLTAFARLLNAEFFRR